MTSQQTVSPALNVLSRRVRWMMAAVALIMGAHLGAADVVTVAGGGSGLVTSGPATDASIAGAAGVVVDPTGGYYIDDYGNACIWHVDASGNIAVVAGIPGTSAFGTDGVLATASTLDIPYAIALDLSGNLFISDQGRIREVTKSTGIITTIAGNGGVGYSGDGSIAISASIYAASGLAVDGLGNVYFTDYTNADVHKVGTDGLLSTVAGNGTAGYSGDGGAATAAELSDPTDLCCDGQGALYIADEGNHTIRKVAGGIITTVAGNGSPDTWADYFAGEIASGPCMIYPCGLTVDSDGAVYYADWSDELIREVKQGAIIDIAGCGGTGWNGDGPALSTWFYDISQISLDQAGHLYIADWNNDRIRELDVPLSTPVITSAGSANGQVGHPFSYQITAGWSPASFSATGLPAGLSVDSGTGIISGTPTATGSYATTMSATNADGTGSANLVIAISAPNPPVLTSAATLNAVAGSPFSATVTADQAATFNATFPGALAASFTINGSTGVITGAPTAAEIGNGYAVPVTLAGAYGTSTTTLSLNILPNSPVFFSATSATAQTNWYFSYTASATGATAYAATFPAPLSSVLSINASTGQITGTPDGTMVGTYAVPITAVGPYGTGTCTLTITVNPGAPFITTYTVSGTAGIPVSVQLGAMNSPTSWSVGSMPPGLNLDPGTGTVSGTPASSFSSSEEIFVTNAYGQTATYVTFSIAAAPTPVITSPSIMNGWVGVPFTYQITATNNPVTFGSTTIDGVSCNAATGVISGTPVAAGIYTMNETATRYGSTGSQYGAIWVYAFAPPVIQGSSTASDTVGYYLQEQLFATNGGQSWTATGLPAGLSISSSGLISGVPTSAGTVTATAAATNPAGTGTLAITFTINPPAPVITSATAALATEYSPFTYQITATNSPTSYTATNLPTGVTVNTATGLISGTPTVYGYGYVTITATNAGGTGTNSFTLTIAQVPPVITSATAATTTVGAAFSYQITATGAPIFSYNATSLPAGLTVNPATGLISGTATASGSYPVTVVAVNPAGPGSQTVTITVLPPAPVITSATAAAASYGAPFSYQITATSSPTSYTATNLPPGVTVNTATGLISGAPTVTGTGTVTITATNAGGTGTGSFLLTISALAPPVITSPTSASATMGVAFTYQITATNSPTSYTATNLPPGVTLNAATGLISGAPTVTGMGTVTLTATNAGGTGSGSFVISIAGGVTPPAITSAAGASGATYSAFSYTITATNSPTSYSATNVPAGLSVNMSTGVISGTPTAVGTTIMTVYAYNAGGNGSRAVTVTISAGSPNAPTITSAASATGNEGTSFLYTITTSPAATSFAATGLPTGFTLNTANGMISASPSLTGTFTVGLSATNSYGTGTKTLTLTLLPPLATITSANPVYEQVGHAMTYQITTSYPATSYSAASLPAGLSLNPSTGLITGTPTTAGSLGYSLTAIDAGGSSTRVTTFVTAAANAPTITSASSAAATSGLTFSYQITATNSPTSYSVSGMPAGLSLNPVTGLISGTPTGSANVSALLSATNASGTNYLPFAFIFTPAPVISSTYTITGNIGSVFSGPSIGATNSPTSWGATNLPPGLFLSSNIISGTPTTTGSWAVTVSATNQTGTGTKVWTINVLGPKPVITSATTASGYIGVQFTYQITATNSPTSYYANGLPAGLSYNSVTGVISGTPTTAVTNQSVLIEAISANGYGYTYVTLTTTTEPVPVVTSATSAAAQVGSAFSYQIAASNAPTSYAATGLPGGLSVSATSGAITGTPTATGAAMVTISATNAGGTGSATLAITVASATPVITSATSATATVGTPFTYQITAANLPTSYGAIGLPAGLSVDPVAGTINGTPTTVGSWAVTVTATNDGGTGTITLVITVGASG
jgi:hypothetical protein